MGSEQRSRRRGLFAAVSRLRRDRKGTTAVEFALIAGPFFFALFATMEVALVMWKGELLDKAMATASRKIWTGEFQAANGTSANPTAKELQDLQKKVKDMICAEVSALVACADIAVDVRDVASFADATPPNPITAQKTYDTSSYGYKPIAPNKIGLVTASFEHKTLLPSLASTKLANGNRVVIATAAFRAEPYTTN